MTITPLVSSVVVLGLTLSPCLGCSDHKTSQVPGFADEYDAALCGMLTRSHLVSSEPYCRSLVTATYRGQVGFNSLAAHLASVRAGKSTFDHQRAAQCLAFLKSLSSIFDSPGAEACTNLFHGTLADGEPCIADGECQPGHHCILASGDCDGVCTPPDGHCRYDSECPSGKVCKSASRSCVDPVPAGADGQACGTNFSCQRGLTCSSAGTCEPPPTEGQPCDNLLCADGLICAINTAFDGACARPGAKGDACQRNGQCGGMLFSNLTCDPASRACVDAFVGGPCAPPFGSFSFESLLGLTDQSIQLASGCDSLISYCDWESSTCKAYPAIGAACNTGSPRCGPPTTCKPNESGSSDGTCTRISSCSP